MNTAAMLSIACLVVMSMQCVVAAEHPTEAVSIQLSQIRLRVALKKYEQLLHLLSETEIQHQLAELQGHDVSVLNRRLAWLRVTAAETERDIERMDVKLTARASDRTGNTRASAGDVIWKQQLNQPPTGRWQLPPHRLREIRRERDERSSQEKLEQEMRLSEQRATTS